MQLKSLRDELLQDDGFRHAYLEEDLIHRVAERVLYYRTQRGMTQEELAVALRTHQPRVANVEAGQNLSLRTLARLAMALDCKPEHLVHGWGEGCEMTVLFAETRVTSGQSLRTVVQPEAAPSYDWALKDAA